MVLSQDIENTDNDKCKCDTVNFQYLYNSINILNNNIYSKQYNPEVDYKQIDNEVKNLNIQIASISNEISNINAKLALNNRSIVENYIDKLYSIEELSTLYKELSEDLQYEIAGDNRLAFIADVNNPGSDQLGFKFTDIIQNAALETVSDAKMTEAQKNRYESKLKNVVSGIYTFTSHSFAQQIASLNPAASATITVFNFLANYYVSDYKVTGILTRTVEVDEKQLFSDKQLEDYLTSIEDFIIYYDDLSVINQEFKLKLNQLDQDFNNLNQNIKILDSIILINNEIIDGIYKNTISNDEVFIISSIYSKTLENIKSINDLLNTNYQSYILSREEFYSKYIEHIEKSEELLMSDLVEKANKTLASKNREKLIQICNDGKIGLDRYSDEIEEIKIIYDEIW
jgi:hypothetical protein